MTRMVPIVVVVPEDTYRKLQRWVATTELPADLRAAVGRIQAEYGWSHEMIALGSLLHSAAKDMAL